MSKITVIKTTTTKAEKGYPIVEVAYKTDDGKTKGMKIFGFGNQKSNADVASKATQGDVLEVEFEKNQKGFWDFKPDSVKSTGSKEATGNSEGSTYSAGQTKGNWETREERAARQVLIVRQSSLATAVALRPKATPEEAIEVAKQFEAYVLGTKQQQPKVEQTGDVE